MFISKYNTRLSLCAKSVRFTICVTLAATILPYQFNQGDYKEAKTNSSYRHC